LISKFKNKIIQGDCLDVLKGLPDNSVDSVVTDPPYGLSKEPDIKEVLTKWLDGEEYDHGHKGFMGKSWDSFVPHPDIWREVYRVLKPGGHALVFAGTRTQDLMTVSLRMAGFEIRDVIQYIFFSGFPKSHNVSKAFDKRAGAEREIIKKDIRYRTSDSWEAKGRGMLGKGEQNFSITAPATPLARKWDGWGTALKPAHEPIILVRKPFKGAVVDNVEQYGTGAINIDASRIGSEELAAAVSGSNALMGGLKGGDDSAKGHVTEARSGRFPANCITLDSDAFYSKYFNITPAELSKKASKKDRNSDWQGNEIGLEVHQAGGLQGRADGSLGKKTYNRNTHPTVKPTDLMAWLIRLITPPNGITLDPFAGSGSTCVAAKREGFNYIGIEMEPEYVEIAKARTGEAV
jgi:site-specific DNA-methyltransferase (adenine-specific)